MPAGPERKGQRQHGAHEPREVGDDRRSGERGGGHAHREQVAPGLVGQDEEPVDRLGRRHDPADGRGRQCQRAAEEHERRKRRGRHAEDRPPTPRADRGEDRADQHSSAGGDIAGHVREDRPEGHDSGAQQDEHGQDVDELGARAFPRPLAKRHLGGAGLGE